MCARVVSVLLCVVLVAPSVHAQPRPATVCKWLTVEEATAVLGPGTKLERAADDGFCVFARGPLSLQIAQPVRMNNPGVLEQAFSGAMKGSEGKLEPGIGNKAFVSANSKRIAFLKGDAFVIVDLMGDGAGAAQLPAFKEAVKKIAARF